DTIYGIGVSMHVPLFKDGEKVGLLEYDLSHDYDVFIDFGARFNSFLKETEIKTEGVASQIRETKFKTTKYDIDSIIGKSEVIEQLKKEIRLSAKTTSTVVIQGDTGTGKELVAHSIHNLSVRRKQNFVKVNAAALPENLIESELFGYEKGAFTGASASGKKGKFEIANGGTIFIDEINNLPLNVQPKLLRVLQEQEIERIGGHKSIPVDVRTIVASNIPLDTLVEEGKLREDLYYRLNVMKVHLKPLRERKEDIPELVNNFVARLNISMGKEVTSIVSEVYDLLTVRNWEGNIRELQNTIERAMNFAEGKELRLEHFDFKAGVEKFDIAKIGKMEKPIEDTKNEAEKKLIIEALKLFNGNKTKTAKYLKIQRPLLYQKINRLEIE
ncbi:MAG: sigma-54 interaction domain-containing protein, partial [Anaerovoracaceae bacterium]